MVSSQCSHGHQDSSEPAGPEHRLGGARTTHSHLPDEKTEAREASLAKRDPNTWGGSQASRSGTRARCGRRAAPVPLLGFLQL